MLIISHTEMKVGGAEEKKIPKLIFKSWYSYMQWLASDDEFHSSRTLKFSTTSVESYFVLIVSMKLGTVYTGSSNVMGNSIETYCSRGLFPGCKSMLTTPSSLLILHIFGNAFQEAFLGAGETKWVCGSSGLPSFPSCKQGWYFQTSGASPSCWDCSQIITLFFFSYPLPFSRRGIIMWCLTTNCFSTCRYSLSETAYYQYKNINMNPLRSLILETQSILNTKLILVSYCNSS